MPPSWVLGSLLLCMSSQSDLHLASGSSHMLLTQISLFGLWVLATYLIPPGRFKGTLKAHHDLSSTWVFSARLIVPWLRGHLSLVSHIHHVGIRRCYGSALLHLCPDSITKSGQCYLLPPSGVCQLSPSSPVDQPSLFFLQTFSTSS